MIERSQGFKTFISFILTIAADVYSDYLKNVVLVLDEPETHLHPSGVRFMRNELLRLAEKGNQVLFATHSIFMIDRQELSRHVIVKKDFESTNILPVKRNNITQESVIYEALGTTTDEFSIKAKNLLFEGDMDRKLFEFYSQNCLQKKENPVEEYELLDGGGTTEISNFFKDKVLPKESKWVLILDNDKPAELLISSLRQIPGMDFEKQFRIMKYSTKKDFELEDLLPSQMVSSAFNTAISKCELTRLNQIQLSDVKPIVSQVQEFKTRMGTTEEEGKRLEKQFKIILGDMIEEKTKEVKAKNTTIATRNSAFEKEFPNYYPFISQVIADLKNPAS